MTMTRTFYFGRKWRLRIEWRKRDPRCDTEHWNSVLHESERCTRPRYHHGECAFPA